MVEATCHCGAVRVEVPKPPQEVEVKECNCSICRRTGAVLAYYSPRDVRVSGATDTYACGDREIEFHRCKICGNFTHWAPVHKSLDRMGVNVRLMPPELLTDLHILEFDGADIRGAQAAGVARPGDPGQLQYAMIGLVTTSFVFAPEYRLMTGIEPFAKEEIEKVANLVYDFLGLPNHKASVIQPKAKRRARG